LEDFAGDVTMVLSMPSWKIKKRMKLISSSRSNTRLQNPEHSRDFDVIAWSMMSLDCISPVLSIYIRR
jgi:hypothetical protein